MVRDISRRIGQTIRALAQRRGISLLELSRRSGVGEAQIYRVCNGKAAPSAEWLARVAPVLDVSAADLLAPLDNVATIAARGKPMDLPPPTNKDTEFRFRLSAHDKAQLEAVAAASSLSAAGAIRSLVAREARALGIVVEPPTKASRRGGRK